MGLGHVEPHEKRCQSVPFGVAVEEQLGLKIERRAELVDILVIEALERPAVD